MAVYVPISAHAASAIEIHCVDPVAYETPSGDAEYDRGCRALADHTDLKRCRVQVPADLGKLEAMRRAAMDICNMLDDELRLGDMDAGGRRWNRYASLSMGTLAGKLIAVEWERTHG